ncbi:peptidoglycan-binding protein [Streptomyces sp. BI20]|uniref:peptidoglycan-binding protein n=1 Tax=Streptomyces sp. BI20 TaxID=3403460 RepID=UPI003C76C182
MSIDSMLAAASADADASYKEGANNDTKFGRWYPMNNEPWCDMAVSMWAELSGNAEAVGKFAYCPSHVNWFKGRGQWLSANSAAKRGDIVFFTWDGGPVADHVGVVEFDAAAGSNVRTIEGNTSSGNSGSQGNGDGVYRRTRGRSVILGFGRPSYGDSGPSGPSRAQVVINGLTYGYGATGDHVTQVGAALVARGFGSHYSEGPGPNWTDADTLNYADFQRSLGFAGSDADGVPGPSSLKTLLGALPGGSTPSKPAGYEPFPGEAFFKRHPNSPIVTAMGKRLVAEGCSAYRVGPSPEWGEADRASFRKWQVKLGDARAYCDGWPGKRQWDALKVPRVSK